MSDPIKRAINGACAFCDEQQEALDKGHSGDHARYRYSQEMILDAIRGNGTFIDVGCANGLLMEELAVWSVEKGYGLEFHGLDISERLIDLVKQRLPHWKDRFYLGNALYWKPFKKFTYICVKELD